MRIEMAFWEDMIQGISWRMDSQLGYLQLGSLWDFHVGCGCAHIVGSAPCELKNWVALHNQYRHASSGEAILKLIRAWREPSDYA